MITPLGALAVLGLAHNEDSTTAHAFRRLVEHAKRRTDVHWEAEAVRPLLIFEEVLFSGRCVGQKRRDVEVEDEVVQLDEESVRMARDAYRLKEAENQPWGER